MRVGWTQGADERVTPQAFTGLAAALERRGLERVDVRMSGSDVPILLVAAPAQRLGPDRVRSWRTAAQQGARILVLGHPDSLASSDVGLALPGLEAIAGADSDTLWVLDDAVPWESEARPLRLRAPRSHIVGRGSAHVVAPDGSVPGELHPRGRGWFRFARTWDVHRAWGWSDGWAFLQLRIGAGCVALLPDATLLADDRLGDVDHRRLLTRVLHAWLPSLHALRAAGEDRSCDRAQGADWLERLRHGLDPHEALEIAPALMGLVEAGLVRRSGARLHLTERGVARPGHVRHVLCLEQELAREDGSRR